MSLIIDCSFSVLNVRRSEMAQTAPVISCIQLWPWPIIWAVNQHIPFIGVSDVSVRLPIKSLKNK